MLQVHLLGQFDIRSDGKRITIPSRAAQSLFAFLILTAGTLHRREKIAGMFWPETSDESARRYLRQELWRIRKALSAVAPDEYLIGQEFTLTFDRESDYWLDITRLEKTELDAESLISNLSLYRGELLPGFYDDWIALERERVRTVFESKMRRLLELLVAAERWITVQEWAEKWLVFGDTPEPAYRALMLAYGARGDMAKVASIYQRCTDDLREQLGVEPSAETRALYDGLFKGAKTPHEFSPLRTRFTGTEEPTPGAPPFKGLPYFEEADTDLFFGRKVLTEKLVRWLYEPHFLSVIVGASGSGKSSLVRAGLIPALRRSEDAGQDTAQNLRLHVMTPTAHPLEALATELTRDNESLTATAALLDDFARDPRSLHLWLRKSANTPLPASAQPDAAKLTGDAQPPHTDRRRVVLVIDQFEELFTLCRDDFEREAFIDNLLYALNESANHPIPPTLPHPGSRFLHSSFTLVLTLRADFYAHLARYPELREMVAKHQEYIGPMTLEELRRAIEEPAKQRTAADGGSWEFEPGVVDLILRDVGDEPGALPLLSHALLETWKRRAGHTLTLKGYADAGGVHGAIAQTAEDVYGNLAPEQRAIARNIFLRLTELGEGTEDTRRRVSFDELLSHVEDAGQVRAVTILLADARLITVGQDTVEVAHEALIREWRRLREWLNQDREGLRLHRSLTEGAHEWELLGRDPGALYRGARRVQAQEWWDAMDGESRNAVNAQERAFLAASKAQEEHETQEREQAQQRELDSVRQIAQGAQELVESSNRLVEEQKARAQEAARSAKGLRWRAYALAGAFVLALVLAGLALQNAGQAESERRLATARELAASAQSNVTIDPERSILLALQAVNKTYALDQTVLPEAEAALHHAVQSSRIEMTLRGHSNAVWGAAFSPDGTRIATSSADGTAKLWDATTGRELLSIKATDNGVVWNVAFSPNGKLLATAGQDRIARIWDASTGAKLMELSGHADEVYQPVFRPDGSRLATVSPDGTSKVWDVVTGKELLTLFEGDGGSSQWLAYSPDGSRIAVANLKEDGEGWATVWDAVTGHKLFTLPHENAYVRSVAFSPDGSRFVTNSDNRTAKIWDAVNGKELLTLYGQTDGFTNAAYSPDGTRIAAAIHDRQIQVWDARTGQALFTLAGHTDAIATVAFSSDGNRLISSSKDGTARVWNVAPSREVLTLVNGPVIISPVGARLVYSPDGTRLAVAYSDPIAKVWDMTTGKLLLNLAGHTVAVSNVAYSTDGTRLATAGRDGTARVWDAASGKELQTFSLPTEFVAGVSFSPDGSRLATAGFDPTAHIWDVGTGKEVLTLAGGHTDWLTSIVFSPDGLRIATSDFDTTAVVWDAVTGKKIFSLTGHTDAVRQIAFSADGKRLATASFDGSAKVWDADSGKELFTLLGHAGGVWSVAFSPDGKYIATASADKSAKIWDGHTGKELLTLEAPDGLTSVAFSPDGSQLATAGRDGTNRIYLLRIGDLVTLAKQRVTRSLTTEECFQYLHVATCPVEP